MIDPIERAKSRVENWKVKGIPKPEEMMKVHRGLGHPPDSSVYKLLVAAGATPTQAAACTDGLRAKCKVCALHDPPPPRPFAGVRVYEGFGEVIEVDLWFLPGRKPILSIVDRGQGWVELELLSSKKGEDMMSVLDYLWCTRYGVPLMIRHDPGKEMENGWVKAYCRIHNISLEGTAATGHHQLGGVEVQNKIARGITEKPVEEFPQSSLTTVLGKTRAAMNLSLIHI